MASIFFSYSHKDEALRDQLETQLAMLKREGTITTWHDRRILSGGEIDHSIDQHVETDDIIVLLVSPDFLASDYCYDREMLRAMERHDANQAIVIPVILRACDWQRAPFGKLKAEPTDGKPVVKWTHQDDAFLEVARAIRSAAQRIDGKEPAPSAMPQTAKPAAPDRFSTAPQPRSSNLRLAKTFNDRDRDTFKHETFDYIARYFENTVAELAARNAEIEGNVRRIDATRFTAALYRAGEAASKCTVFVGGQSFGEGIGYINGETSQSNSYNELLSVDADDDAMFLRSIGMGMTGSRTERKLSQEGAAETLWTMFVGPLQQGGRSWR